jgi:hypothetical protein
MGVIDIDILKRDATLYMNLSGRTANESIRKDVPQESFIG